MKQKTIIETMSVLAIAMLLSVVMTWSVHPFIGTADGFKRIWVANGGVGGFIVLPPMQSYFFKASLSLTGGMFLYTAFQCLLFYISIYTSIRIGNKRKIIVIASSLIVILTPVTLIFPLITTDSAFVFITLSLIPVTIINASQANGFKKLLWYVCLFSLSVSLFGFRFNSITTLPVILASILYFFRKKSSVPLSIVLLSVLCVMFINKDVRNNSRPESLGMAWEIVSLIKNNSSDRSFDKTLDFCGDTIGAVNAFDSSALNSIFWYPKAPLPVKCITSPEGSDQVKKEYFRLWRQHPVGMMRVKVAMWSSLFGVSAPLKDISHGINEVNPQTTDWGAIDNTLNHEVRKIFFDTGNALSLLTLRPINSFILLFALLIASYYQNKRSIEFYIIPTLLSISYYCGFMISAQSMEFRYFAPSFFINTTMTISILISFAFSSFNYRKG